IDRTKHEVPMTKHETSTKRETPSTQTEDRAVAGRLGFSDLDFEFVSCFGIRISCFSPLGVP
ncbi:MAG: hypothetical protein KJ579_10185, partial [Verrucomicrobia bacterium]|nr:hypothetical protein [Verrucomicrobiota bacterium]